MGKTSIERLHEQLKTTLIDAAKQLRETGLPLALVDRFDDLARQVIEPCVVAVVGRMKAGKSAFINALLGEDLAKVGATETTATINEFHYGQPPDPGRPVRCVWRSGQSDWRDQAFLDSLQGNDLETLQRAMGIDHLEYYLLNPHLKQATLVDTPGTGAAVDEHQNATAEYIGLLGQLRERHDQETRRLGGETDAVIYLIGATARSSDQNFLDEFRHTTQGQARAFNAVGVIAKIDLHPAAMERREELAKKIAQQLQDSLNTVLPVSAGLERGLAQLLQDGKAGLNGMIIALRSIPPKRLEKLLDSDELYRFEEFPDCPVSAPQRQELLGDMPWQVFTTIARVAADPSLDAATVEVRVKERAGFDLLKSTLERHFFERSHFLRIFRIVNEARKVLDDAKYTHRRQLRRRASEERSRRERFLKFIRQANGDQSIARELEAFVSERSAEHVDLEPLFRDLDRAFAYVYHYVEEYSADFEALKLAEDHANLFAEELGELQRLLGLHGLANEDRLPADSLSVEYAEGRQRYWRRITLDRNPVRHDVAERAETRYGLILHDLLTRESENEDYEMKRDNSTRSVVD